LLSSHTGLTILKRLCRKFGIPRFVPLHACDLCHVSNQRGGIDTNQAIFLLLSFYRWPYRRLKCTIKPKDAPRKPQQPEFHQQKQHQSAHDVLPASPSLNSDELTTSQRQQQQRRTDRPQRQAALGVQEAVVRAKADINDDEIATVVVAPRNGKNSENATTTAVKGIAPRVSDLSTEDLAYQSMSAEESQALSVLLGGIGRDPTVAAAVMAGTPRGVAGALLADHTPFLTKTETRDAVPTPVSLTQEPPVQQEQQEQQEIGINSMFDANLLKSMELAMQMHFVAEQQRQQHAAVTAAMAAFAAAAPSSSSSGQQLQNAQMFAAIMQTLSNMNAPQDPAAAMLARSMIDSFNASATSMPPWMAPFFNPQAAAADWNKNGAASTPALAAPTVSNDGPH